ncbi:MAG: nucleotide exchange factor GrpE [Dehalococcoidales bacterium]|nr:MAG: nucleotide exchange factor GrpE [Dehalococcoidales bacterium]
MEEENINENESLDDVLEGVEEDDIEVLKQSLVEEKTKAEEYLANWQRTQADFINYRRRNDKEKEELGEYSRAAIVQCVLPILDDFERAISAMPDQEVDSNWVEGVRMIEKKLRTILESEGLSCIEAVGESFDPYQHEAVRQESGEEGVVLDEVQKGYKFNEKVIRASQVVVGNGEEKVND